MLKKKSNKLIAILLSVLLSGLIPAAVTLADSLIGDADGILVVNGGGNILQGSHNATFTSPYKLIPGETKSFLLSLGIEKNSTGIKKVEFPVKGIAAVTGGPGGATITAVVQESPPATPSSWTLTGYTIETSGTFILNVTAPSQEGWYDYVVTFTATSDEEGNLSPVWTTATLRVEVKKPASLPDTTPPVLSHTIFPAASNGENGWYNSSVNVGFSYSDEEGGSGIKMSTIPPNYTLTDDGIYGPNPVSVSDNSGNTTSITIPEIRIDKTAPSITPVLPPTGWTKGTVEISLTAEDLGSGIKSITGPSGTVVTGNTATYSATSNGKYTFKAEDLAGNTSEYEFNVGNIDTTAPSATHDLNPKDWTNEEVEITINATDSGSGIKSITLPSETVVESATATYKAPGNGSYFFTLEDLAGNSFKYEVNIEKFDDEKPSATHTLTPEGPTNTDVIITVNAIDSGSGVKSITDHNNNATVGSTAVFSAEENGTYTFIIKDNAGNTRNYDVTITNIDKIAPEATKTLSPNGWTNGNVTITVNATDLGGSEVKSITDHNGDVTIGATAVHTVEENGKYTFIIEDNAGNISKLDVEVTNIDKIAPEANSVIDPEGWTNGNVTITVNATDLGGSGLKSITGPVGTDIDGNTAVFTATVNDTYTFILEDNVGNTFEYKVDVEKIDKTKPTATHSLQPNVWTKGNVEITVNATDIGSGIKSITGPVGTVVDGSTAVFTATVNDTYNFILEDNAGNTFDYVVTVDKIDKSAPTAIHTLNPEGWTGGNVVVTVNVTDIGSGVKSITGPVGTIVDGNTATFTATENDTFTFFFEDKVGNTSTHDVTVAKIDKSDPTATHKLDPDDWTNGNVLVTVTATDIGSGLKSITGPEGTMVTGNVAVFTAKENKTYNFLLEDNVGNTSTHIVEVKNIDTTAPSATNVLDTYKWTKGDVTVTVNATDIGSGLATINGPQGTEVDGATAIFTAKENGNYTFTLIDNVGNTFDYVVKVTNIDKTAPEATRTLDPEEWTNGNVKITVNATDLGGSEVKSITDPSKNVTNGSSAIFTATENDTYTFIIEDNAGNTFDFTVVIGKIDRVNPTVSSNIDPVSAIWTNGNVKIIVTGDDDASGIKSIGILNDAKTETLLNLLVEETDKRRKAEYSVSVNGTYVFLVTDRAGNSIEHRVVITNIDKTKPEINITTPVNGAVYKLNEVVLANWSVVDNESGIASSPSATKAKGMAIDTTSVGQKFFTVSAIDVAGNTESITVSYSVVYDFSGFFQPIEMGDNVINSAKAGSSIPIKFSLNGYMGMNIFELGSPRAYTYTDNQGTKEISVIPIEVLTAGKSGLSYDSETKQYTYVWKTDKSWAKSAKQLAVTLSDGKTYYAYFTFK